VANNKKVAITITEIKKLHEYLDELDRRRKTDWRSLFPYLVV
jgi:hypothetical protein